MSKNIIVRLLLAAGFIGAFPHANALDIAVPAGSQLSANAVVSIDQATIYNNINNVNYTANTAVNNANSALELANNANNSANYATNLANGSQATANHAVNLANGAQGTANAAYNSAVNGYGTWVSEPFDAYYYTIDYTTKIVCAMGMGVNPVSSPGGTRYCPGGAGAVPLESAQRLGGNGGGEGAGS